MILDWDYSGILSDQDEAAIRLRVANGEVLIRTEMDMGNGVPPIPSYDWLLSPSEIEELSADADDEGAKNSSGY